MTPIHKVLVVLAILAGAVVGLFFAFRHHHSTHVETATCWARPGVIDHRVNGRWAPTYTPAGTRHGPGDIKGVCGP